MGYKFDESALEGRTAVDTNGLMAYLGCSRSTILRLSHQGGIPKFFVLSGMKYYKVDDILEFYRGLTDKQNRQAVK